MRLLHTKELSWCDTSKQLPGKYAILSHTWNKTELSFQDLGKPDFRSKNGYDKIYRSCGKAKEHHDWIWIDSCCIDGSSSAELSEAINSMYQWYEDSEVCYVYLEDFDEEEATLDNLRRCKWFKRGWTLQELLAPPSVIFCNKSWNEIGTRRELAKIISTVTGIPLRVFQGSSPRDCTVAQRFSWAANRETTRSEDIAYCLLGLFDVHMAPIYGEGSVKAFIRLQEEIMKRYDDQSIFIWTPKHEPRNLGLLATSPSSFCKHEGCFEWLHVVTGGPQSQFDPYELFEPTGYYAKRVIPNQAGYVVSIPQILRYSVSQIVTPTLGPQGLQVSLLASETIGTDGEPVSEVVLAKTLMTICFDLIINTDSFSGVRILLRMTFDLMLGFNSQDISRRGLVHRVPALFEGQASYFLTGDRSMYQRQTFYVSQQLPTGQAQHVVKFTFADLPPTTEVVEQCFHEPTPAETRITESPRTIKCKGGMLSFYHNCPSTGTMLPFLVVFGIHGRRPSPWCYMKTAALGPITESHIRNLSLINYFQVECRSGYFKNCCFRILPCKHIFRAMVLPDEDPTCPTGFRISISIGELGAISGSHGSRQDMSNLRRLMDLVADDDVP